MKSLNLCQKKMHTFCFRTSECNMGTTSAFLFSFWVLCSVWYVIVRLGVCYSKVLWLKYFVLHKSTGAAKHKRAIYQLIFVLGLGLEETWEDMSRHKRRLNCQATMSCDSMTSPAALARRFLSLEGKASGETRASGLLSAVSQSVYLESVFLFCTQPSSRVTVATVADCIQYCSVTALKSPQCASQSRPRWPVEAWAGNLKYVISTSKDVTEVVLVCDCVHFCILSSSSSQPVYPPGEGVFRIGQKNAKCTVCRAHVSARDKNAAHTRISQV